MQHDTRVNKGDQEENASTQLESIMIRAEGSVQDLREDSIHDEREPGERFNRSVANSDQEEDQPQRGLDGRRGNLEPRF
jgi:hypothetical protein